MVVGVRGRADVGGCARVRGCGRASVGVFVVPVWVWQCSRGCTCGRQCGCVGARVCGRMGVSVCLHVYYYVVRTFLLYEQHAAQHNLHLSLHTMSPDICSMISSEYVIVWT